MTPPTFDDMAMMHYHICQALGDIKRCQILYALDERPRYVTELATLLGAPQPTISRHLAILLERGIVTKTRHGPAVMYSLVDHRIIHIMNQMRDLLPTILAQNSGDRASGDLS